MFVRAMENILIAGAGITGALTAAFLRNRLPKCRLTVWEKTNTIGGRMKTIKHPHGHKCTVDLGAQYISTQLEDFNANKRGLLKPLQGEIENDRIWPQGTQHFVAPNGMNSLVEYYLEQSGAKVELKYDMNEIYEKDEHYIVNTTDGTTKTFDCVILTMPVPDLLHLRGIIPKILDRKPDIKEKLSEVQYSSRFAMGLYYEPGTQIEVPWAAKYFRSDPVIVFIAADNKKRGQEGKDTCPSLLVHASVPFSLKHIQDDVDKVCTENILPRVHAILPQLAKPTCVSNHLWKVSQVYKGYKGKPGMLILHDQPLLVCGGDAFTESQFDRCIESASALSKAVARENCKDG